MLEIDFIWERISFSSHCNLQQWSINKGKKNQILRYCFFCFLGFFLLAVIIVQGFIEHWCHRTVFGMDWNELYWHFISNLFIFIPQRSGFQEAQKVQKPLAKPKIFRYQKSINQVLLSFPQFQTIMSSF